MKRVKIIGKEHGKDIRVYIDGVEQKHVSNVIVDLSANNFNKVTITYHVEDVEIEIDAEPEIVET